jgi:hypothetical protein
MTGKIIKIGNPHYCEKPDLYKWRNRKLLEGTQWQCDDCNDIYEIKNSYYAGFHWVKISGNLEDAS